MSPQPVRFRRLFRAFPLHLVVFGVVVYMLFQIPTAPMPLAFLYIVLIAFNFVMMLLISHSDGALEELEDVLSQF